MKNRILLIIFLISSFWGFSQSVPNTTTFSLQDVYDVVHSHASGTATNLQSCFDNSIDAYFDVNYKGSKNSLYNFRNYTVSASSIPTVTTTDVSERNAYLFAPTDYSLYLYVNTYGGNVTSQGSSAVTVRGIVYSTINTTPTVGGANTTNDTNGSGTGVFSEDIRTLVHGTLYYVRAYATNSNGTGYGAVKTFTVCERDINAVNTSSNFNASYVYNGTTYYFSTLAAAQSALYNYHYNTGTISVWNGGILYYVALTNGNTAYINLVTSIKCDKIDQYWVNYLANPYQILYVVDGVIQSLTTYSP